MAKVRYQWVPTAQGGRRALPTGPFIRYPIELSSGPDKNNVLWDVVFCFESPAKFGIDQIGTIEYSSERAPRHRLEAGVELKLLEGHKAVVKGTILSE